MNIITVTMERDIKQPNPSASTSTSTLSNIRSNAPHALMQFILRGINGLYPRLSMMFPFLKAPAPIQNIVTNTLMPLLLHLHVNVSSPLEQSWSENHRLRADVDCAARGSIAHLWPAPGRIKQDHEGSRFLCWKNSWKIHPGKSEICCVGLAGLSKKAPGVLAKLVLAWNFFFLHILKWGSKRLPSVWR